MTPAQYVFVDVPDPQNYHCPLCPDWHTFGTLAASTELLQAHMEAMHPHTPSYIRWEPDRDVVEA